MGMDFMKVPPAPSMWFLCVKKAQGTGAAWQMNGELLIKTKDHHPQMAVCTTKLTDGTPFERKRLYAFDDTDYTTIKNPTTFLLY